LSLRGELDFVVEPIQTNQADPVAPHWGTFVCSSCYRLTLAETFRGSKRGKHEFQHVENLYPQAPTVAEELPDRAKRYLSQAIESLHAPDGAAMLAGSAVDAMLKAKGYTENSLYERINKAAEDSIITSDMAEWAHSVRLGSNRPRHADNYDPHVTAEQAAQACEFVKVLGQVLFELPSKIAAGKCAAEALDSDDD
jgi:hypothetical protein